MSNMKHGLKNKKRLVRTSLQERRDSQRTMTPSMKTRTGWSNPNPRNRAERRKAAHQPQQKKEQLT